MAETVTFGESTISTLGSNFDPTNPTSVQNQLAGAGVVGDVTTLANDIGSGQFSEDASAVGVATTQLGSTLSSLTFSSQEERDAVMGIAGSIAEDLIQRKLEELKASLLAKRRVKIKSLINSVGGCVTQTGTEFVESVTTKLTDFATGLPKALAQLAQELGSEIASDPQFQESLQGLDEVQWLSNVIGDVYGMYNSVKKISDKVEPFFPVIEIVVEAASIWATAGASIAAFSADSALLAMVELKKAIPLIVTPLKNALYDTEIEVPAFLLGMLDFSTNANSTSRFSARLDSLEKSWEIDDASFAAVNRGLRFPGAYTNITALIGSNPKTGAFISNIITSTGSWGPLVRTFFFDVADASYWAGVRSEHAKQLTSSNGLMNEILALKMADIKKLSLKIVDNRDSSATFYVDRQMLKLVADELEADGCIIDMEAQSYDELGTLLNAEGDRGVFTKLNNLITDYHAMLALLTGEIRANIEESIPVIDFYRKGNTSLTTRYMDTVEFNSFQSITDKAKEGVDAYAITSTAIDSDTPPIFNINLAIAGYADADYFYNTRAVYSEEKNLVVEYNQDTTPLGPGILNGLFSKNPTRDEFGAIIGWTWVDERAELPGVSDNLPLGTKYTQYHLLNRGTIVEQPLYTATPGFGGKAEEWYSDVTTFVNTEIVARFTIASATWNSLGSRIDSITLKSYGDNTSRSRIFHRVKTQVVRTAVRRGYSIKGFALSRQVSLESYYPAKLQVLATITPSIWTSKNQNLAGKDYLVIDTAAAGQTAVVYTGKKSSDEIRIRAKEDLISNRYAMFTATVKSYTPFLSAHRYYVDSINILSPFEMIRNRFSAESNPSTILYSPNDGTTLGELYIISKVDLGFSLADSGRQSLCTFYDQGTSLSFQVTAIDYFSPNLVNFKVVTATETFIYEEGVSDYDRPIVTFEGPACWIYKLSPIQVSDPDIRADFYPLRYPASHASISSQNRFASDWNIGELLNKSIGVSLPTLTGGQTYASYSKNGANFGVMDRLLGQSVVSNYIRGKIKVLPVIAAELPSTVPITVENFHLLVAPWIKAAPTLHRLASTSMPELDKLVLQLPVFSSIISALSPMLNAAELITLDKCKNADRLLGNASTPWLSIGDDPGDVVSEAALDTLVSSLKEALDGTLAGSYPVRFLPGDSSPQGRLDSLYYQRYIFLNNRMNKSEGTLSKAASMLGNWSLVKDSDMFKAGQVDGYLPYIDAVPVSNIDSMLYVPPASEAEEGRFYIQKVIDGIKNQISDKCMLICSPCPVRDTCPFYDEASVLKQYVPPVSTLDIWLKDNELDLIAYQEDSEGTEILQLTSDDGGVLSPRGLAEKLKSAHRVYAEIIRDPLTDMDIDSIRNNLAARVPGFKKADGTFSDGMDWITGGRYGSLSLKTRNGVLSTDPDEHSYLYNAVFIRDEESFFEYKPTSNTYPVSLRLSQNREQVTYSGAVHLKEPVELKLFADAKDDDEVYLISDDTRDVDGFQMDPVIYIGMLKNISYDFDFDRNGADIMSESDIQFPGPGDIAQWSVNICKGIDATPDQYWMPRIQKVVRGARTSGSALITLAGRPREADVVDPLISEAPSAKDLARGKLFIKPYTNYIRKIRISLSSIEWSKDDKSRLTIEKKKKQLSSMKTKLRLVVVKK